MIYKRELLEKARQKNLSLMMVDKDYALGWLLFGFAKDTSLVFKGGTALSKVYFPRIWRLSEDLDFSLIRGELKSLFVGVEKTLAEVTKASGIGLTLQSRHMNPDYLQLKVQYKGVIGKNWIKVDITLDDLVDEPVIKPISREYSDHVPFDVRIESLDEIFASKLRAVIERRKCRDFFDLWKLGQMDFDRHRLRKIVERKLAVKKLDFPRLEDIFADDLQETLKPYWERELGRLVSPLPEITDVLSGLRKTLRSF